MSYMRVMVQKLGFADIEADSDEEALNKAEKVKDSDFDWWKPCGAEIVGDIGSIE